jgi:hypothetical protein
MDSGGKRGEQGENMSHVCVYVQVCVSTGAYAWRPGSPTVIGPNFPSTSEICSSRRDRFPLVAFGWSFSSSSRRISTNQSRAALVLERPYVQRLVSFVVGRCERPGWEGERDDACVFGEMGERRKRQPEKRIDDMGDGQQNK